MGGERIPTGGHHNAVSRQLPLLCHKVSRTRRGFLSPVSSLSFLSLSLSLSFLSLLRGALVARFGVRGLPIATNKSF
jgi:hypothetical protein